MQVEETQLDPVSQPDSMSTEAEHQATMSKIALAMLIASTVPPKNSILVEILPL